MASSVFVEKIAITSLHKLKYSSRKYYVTIDPKVIASYGLLTGDLLKIQIIEARKDREQPEEKEESTS